MLVKLMLRFTTNVTSSPTTSRRNVSASAATASIAGPSAVARARYSSSLHPPGVGGCPPLPAHAGSEPRVTGLHVVGLRGKALHQFITRGGGHLGQVVQRRPRPFRVDVVGCQRRDAAPVVHTSADQREAFVAGH